MYIFYYEKLLENNHKSLFAFAIYVFFSQLWVRFFLWERKLLMEAMENPNLKSPRLSKFKDLNAIETPVV